MMDDGPGGDGIYACSWEMDAVKGISYQIATKPEKGKAVST